MKKASPTRTNTPESTMQTARRAGTSATNVTWDAAIADFLTLIRGTREEKKATFHSSRVSVLSTWAKQENILLVEFRSRHLRQYLAHRADAGVSDATRRHDAVASRAFLKFCAREEYVSSDPLRGYQVPKSSRPYVKCPSDDEIRALLIAVTERWDISTNPGAKYFHASARRFFSRRNYAIMAGLIETAARDGEMLSLRLQDYQPEQGQIAIPQSKGDEPRMVPISQDWMDSVQAYLRVRPAGIDTDRVFVSEFGESLSVEMFSKQFRGYLNYAGLSGFTLHGLRHYAITLLAKTDVWTASQIAGHKDLKITRQYLQGDPAHVKAVHAQAAPHLYPHSPFPVGLGLVRTCSDHGRSVRNN